MRRMISLLLLAAILCTAACSDVPAESGDTTDNTTSDSGVVSESYNFTKEYEGGEFRILNADDIYSMHAVIDPDEQNGDTLNDAMFERVSTFEENTGVTLVEENVHVEQELHVRIQNVVMSGEDAYDVVYINESMLSAFAAEGYFYNLLDYDELQLDKDWWIGAYNDESIVAGKLHAALGYSQLMAVDSLWCLFFNEDMMDDLDLDYPYELVRSGKWTIDRLKEYAAAGAQLNGDESFAFTETGRSIVGISASSTGIWGRFMFGAGERTVESDGNKLVLTAGTERYYDVVSKFASSFDTDSGSVFYAVTMSSDDSPGHYIWMFENERALFMTAEICKSGRLRDKDFSFGVLPFPKLDDAQENYYHGPFMNVPGFAIPVTSETPERSAALGDALTYLSYEMVLPTFREITLEQKNLRSDDAIEMLDIIIKSTTPILTNVYSVGKELISEVSTAISQGSDAVSSMVAANKDKINASLDKING